MRLLNDRYEVLDVVGRGGEGTVLRALDRRHHRLVALKRRRLPLDDGEAERFMLEARTLLSMPPHPGLPLARDDFFDDDHHYLVLDWIEGIDLASFVAEHGRPGLPVATVLRWLASVARTLKLNDPDVVGVPATTPPVESEMPAGSAPEESVNEWLPIPPVAAMV